MSKNHEIVLTARALLANEIGVIEASRKLVSLHYEAQLENEETLKIFWVIDSETDHLPIGQQRENYSSQRLVEIDEEIRGCEEFYKEVTKAACNALIEKYS